MSKASMKDLAKALNLSTATVSKALRDAYDISEETKQRVLALAKELRYIPNAHASSLRGKKSKTIAIVLPAVADSFFAQAINGVEQVAHSEGYHVMIYLTHERFDKEKEILGELLNGKVDGVLLSLSAESTQLEHIQQLQTKGMPIVLFDRAVRQVGDGCVMTNDEEISYKLTQHLLEEHNRPTVFLAISDNLSIIKLRINGYSQALSAQGQAPSVLYCDHDEDQNYHLIKQQLMQETKPLALIAGVEKLVPLIYLACKELNLSIPKDVKVAAFANMPTAAILHPSLTTVTQPAFKIGQTATQLLLRIIKGKPIDQEDQIQIIPSEIEFRASTFTEPT